MPDRPQELRKPVVLGNWRKKTPKKPSRILRRPGMSDDHLEYIRAMPCCVSLYMPAGEVHHLKSGEAKKERGVGMRATDQWGLPLRHHLHMDLERIASRYEVGWFQDHGIENPHTLAKALWAATGDLERMIRVLMAHRKSSDVIKSD